MINCKDIIGEVEFSYQSERNDKEFKLNTLKEQLLKSPKYAEVCEKLSVAIFDCNKAEFEEDEEKAANLQKKIEELKKVKAKIEAENGLSEFGYECNLCNDTGNLTSGKCSCFYRRVTDACYNELSVQKPNLVTFKDDTLSVKNGTSKYFEKLEKYAESFGQDSKNLIFTGKTGTGKTFLSQAIAQKISQNNNVVLFLTASALNNVYVENMYSSPYEAKKANDILETCDFLVIDDLGAERLLKKITVENLYVLISARNEAKKPYLITTNLTLNEINTRYGDRLFSRLTSKNTLTINFVGSDLRKQ